LSDSTQPLELAPQRPPSISRAAARRIDRLSRRAHRFHRFAHHPLCEEYAGEVLHAGSLVLCRGCVLGGSGVLLGLAAGLALAPPPVVAALAALAGALAVATVRESKLGKRLLPALGLNLAIGAGLRLGGGAGAALVVAPLVVAGGAFLLYRRRGPDRSPCARCPERDRPEVCRGFAPILEREAEVRAAARAVIDGETGPVSPAAHGEKGTR
jgi:hypothetical protein